MEFDKDIIKVLWNSIMIYRNRCLECPKLKSTLLNDDNCNGEDDYEYFIMIYLVQALTKEKNGVKIIYNKLIDAGIDKKKTNTFIYNFLKMNYKCDTGTWSWNEIDEFDIDIDRIKNTTTKYKFF